MPGGGADAGANATVQTQRPTVIGFIGTVKTFNPSVNNYEIHQKQLNQYFLIDKITNCEIKRAILLKSLSEDAYQTITDLCVPEDPDEVAFEQLLVKFKSFYGVKTSVWGERLKFYSSRQEQGETLTV